MEEEGCNFIQKSYLKNKLHWNLGKVPQVEHTHTYTHTHTRTSAHTHTHTPPHTHTSTHTHPSTHTHTHTPLHTHTPPHTHTNTHTRARLPQKLQPTVASQEGGRTKCLRSPACGLLKVTPIFSFLFPYIFGCPLCASHCTKHPLNTSIFHVDL